MLCSTPWKFINFQSYSLLPMHHHLPLPYVAVEMWRTSWIYSARVKYVWNTVFLSFYSSQPKVRRWKFIPRNNLTSRLKEWGCVFSLLSAPFAYAQRFNLHEVISFNTILITIYRCCCECISISINLAVWPCFWPPGISKPFTPKYLALTC